MQNQTYRDGIILTAVSQNRSNKERLRYRKSPTRHQAVVSGVLGVIENLVYLVIITAAFLMTLACLFAALKTGADGNGQGAMIMLLLALTCAGGGALFFNHLSS